MNRNRLDDLSWAMSQVYSGVEDRILINLAKYFPMVQAKGQMTGSFEYQARMLGKMGSVTKDTIAIITGSLGNADEALRRSLTTAILDALKGEETKLIAAARKGILLGIPGEIAPSMMQAFRTYYKQSADKLNLVNTVMLESTQAAYTAAVTDAAARIQQIQGALNLGAGEVITGVSAWNQAMRTTVQSMVKAGITGYIDHAGRRWSPEAYVAMDIRTTMFNTSRAAVWERNQQYNNDLYQVSSHMGARPLCYPWQGKVLSTSGRTGTTTDLDGNEVVIHSEAEVESFRYGGGLFGVNCGHYPMVFIPGFSTLKDVPQDEEENAKTYAESQQQRALERKLREEKRDLEVMKAQGMGEEAIKAQQERVRRASGDLDTFCEETGRHRDRAREYTPIDAKWPDPSTYDPTKFPTAEREKIREWFANGGRDNPPPRQGGMHLGPNNIPPAAQTQIPITPTPPTPPTPPTQPTSDYVLKELPASGIKAVPVKKFDTQPTMEEMIARIGGGDRTQGSCASLAWTWAGERAGYDVLDFRDGISRSTFSMRVNSFKVSKFPGVISWTETSTNDVKAATALLKHVEKGKEYAIMTGCHASIVRLTDEGYQYLELQSPVRNGWFTLDPKTTFRWRFGCKQSNTRYGMKIERDNLLIQIDTLTDSPDFAKMLEYINTQADMQKKGVAGGIK